MLNIVIILKALMEIAGLALLGRRLLAGRRR